MMSSMVDPISQSFIPPSVALTQGDSQGGGSMFTKLTGSSMTSKVCQLGLVSTGATCDMLVIHLMRKRQRARVPRAATAQQQVQPASGKTASWGDRLVIWVLDKLPRQVVQRMSLMQHRALIMVLVALVGLGFVSWDLRRSAASRRWKQKPVNKKFVPLKSMEQEEPDAEPLSRNWRTCGPGNELRRCTSDQSGISKIGRASCRERV